ncbi:MAG: 5-(carboxyamino)imidazole ribonucleotide synthase [Microbacteriaceae bacterium]|nr:5-(carboxyamino)imidazole ribonucleotide synthase [Microbacteriaceae bacterium]
MMIPASINLGIELQVLAEAENSSAHLAATSVGDYRDMGTVLAFAENLDVITFDHEHVPQEILEALTARGKSVQPPASALALAQDKLWMRESLSKIGAPLPKWARVSDVAELDSFIQAVGGKAIVKTPIGGYDGKGVRVVGSASDASDWLSSSGSTGLLAEELVPFDREVSQLLARSTTGEIKFWPLVETVQREGICTLVRASQQGLFSEGVQNRATEIAQEIAEGIGLTGVLAVEMFQVGEELLVNELAMRPHNSGHWTIDGSVTSQFEQHLRAVAGLPLGSAEMTSSAVVMANIIGGKSEVFYSGNTGDVETEKQILGGALAKAPDAKIHIYGKDARKARKVGHVTVATESLPESERRAVAVAVALGAENLS